MAIIKTLTVGGNTYDIPVTSVNGQTGDITVTSPSPSSATPADLGVASAGVSDDYSRADHVHRMLTASDLKFPLPVDTASGAVASFPDGADGVPVESLSVAITPVQDLHGQSSPYPAGGGKNKFDLKAALDYWGATYTDNGDGSYTVTELGTGYSNPYVFLNSDATMSVSAASVTNIGTASGWMLQFMNSSNVINANIKSDGLTAAGVTICKVRLNYGTKGSGATFKNVMAETGSSATTYAPYSNICPITGFSRAVVTRTGKNLYKYDADKVEVVTTSTQTQRAAMHTGLYGPGTFSFSGSVIDPQSVTSSNINIATYKDGIATLLNGFITTTQVIERTFTFAEGEEVCFLAASDQTASITLNLPRYNIQIEVGSTVTPYEQRTEQTVTIDLSGTRYGGSLDVKTGVLTITKRIVTCESTWTPKVIGTVGSYTRWQFYSGETGASAADGTDNGRFSHGTYEVGYSTQKNHAYVTDTGATVITLAGVTATEAGVQAYVAAQTTAGTPLQIVYPLATPLSVQLTPAEMMQTILGQNNVWSNTGDTTVQYRADIQKYIDKKTS